MQGLKPFDYNKGLLLLDKTVKSYIFKSFCRSGGIGRRAGFKIKRSY